MDIYFGFSVETMEDGFNKYRITIGDTDSFIRCIQEVWDNPDGYERLGRNGK